MATKTVHTILTLTDKLSGGLVKAARNTKGISKEMVSATREVVQFKNKAVSAISGVLKSTAKLGAAAAGAAAAGLATMAVKAGAAADDLNTLSKQSGFSTDDLQQWKYAADVVDVSVEDITASATKMKRNMASNSADVTEAWQAIGVSARDSNGQLRDSTTVFYEVLQGLSGIKNETQRDVYAMQLFGRSADSLAGIVDDGGASLRELGQQAKDAGLILGQDALNGANAFNDVLDILKAKASASFGKAGSALATQMLPAMERLQPVVEGLMNGAVSLLTEKVGLLAEKFAQWEADGTIDRLSTQLTAGLTTAAETASGAFQWLQEHGDGLLATLKFLGGVLITLQLMKLATDAAHTVQSFGLFVEAVGLLTKGVLINGTSWLHNTALMCLNKAGLLVHAGVSKAAAAGTGLLTGAQKLLNLAFVASPIGWVVLGVLALVAAGILLYKNWDKVKATASALWESAKRVFGGIRDSVTGAFDGAKAKVSGFFGWIGDKLSALDGKLESVPILGSLYKGAKSAGSWAMNRISGHATGTSFFSGGLTRVHERGGEILRLPGGTQIIPHDLSRQLVGGSPISVHVTVQGNVIGNRAYADTLGNTIALRILRALRNS